MTDSKPIATTPAQATHKRTPRRSKKLNLLWFAVLILTILLAISHYGIWYSWQKVLTLSEQTNHLADATNTIDKRLFQLAQDNKNYQLQLTKLDKQALFNGKQLNQLHGSKRADWLLAEAEYLLRLANQRLNMERDYLGATSILNQADNVLAESDDPGLFPIRKAIYNEMTSLQAIYPLDIEAVYLKLESLISQLDNIEQRVILDSHHLQSDPSNLESNTPLPVENYDMQSFFSEAWHVLQRYITVRQLDKPVAPLLPPAQLNYLKQNIRLMLEQTEIALLKGNKILYQRSLAKANAYIEQYFYSNNSVTKRALDALKELQSIDVAPQIPDISGSLKLLKNRINSMYKHHNLNSSPRQSSANAPLTMGTQSEFKASPSAPQAGNTLL